MKYTVPILTGLLLLTVALPALAAPELDTLFHGLDSLETIAQTALLVYLPPTMVLIGFRLVNGVWP